MNTKRIIFWIIFVVILGLIVWGLSVAMNKPAPGQNLAAPAPVTSADHIIGLANAPVTLIEYGDFECPACGLYAPIVEKLIANASTTLRVVFRHFPLPQHANAMITAETSEAAAMQGKFWEMYKLIYANQADWENLSDAHTILDGYAGQIGLDMTKFKADIDSAAAKSVVLADLNEGEHVGINQTPTFFVNGKAIVNPQGYEAFKALIDAAAQ
jgi:protein-disulfide isomerase